MRRLMVGVMLAMTCAAPAMAQTLLRLSETALVAARPDELAASLRAEAQSGVPAQAQSAVNAAMARALETVKAVAGVSARTGGYQVVQVQQPSPHWQAAQTLTLTGRDGTAILTLVGALQAQGLAVQGLAWRLAPETERQARDGAAAKALAGLRGRAEAAAKVLGLSFERFQEVRLDGAQAPRPMPRMAAAMGMAAPVAEAGDVDVSATVEADVLLK